MLQQGQSCGMCSCPSPRAGSLLPAPFSCLSSFLIFIFRCQFNSLNWLTVGQDECQGLSNEKVGVRSQGGGGEYAGLLWLVAA